MKIKKLLVSQPAPVIADKSPYSEIITKHKTEVAFRPFIRVEGVSLKEFRAQRIDILSFSAIIFTSKTIIDNFFHICEEARIQIPETMKYFCNNEANALYLQKYIVYRKRKIFFADGTFNNFMEIIAKHKEENFLLTLAEPHKPEMPIAMDKLKLKYGKGIDLRGFDMMVFYSPSEISSLTTQFPDRSAYPLIATFGTGTTKAAIDAGLKVSTMAPTPEAPSMTKAIDIFITKYNAGKNIEEISVSESPEAAFIKAQEEKNQKKAKASACRGAAPKPAKCCASKVQPEADAAISLAAKAAQNRTTDSGK